ncbi:MAG: hypothetical protein Q8O32_03650 [bacterium]|nr:hypothetical protein [bacterium]
MSLEATHIRFALELKDSYQIKNLPAYLAGAIYPDSRYVTTINRNLTHAEICLNKNWADTDFKKGWQTHNIYDLKYKKISSLIFPDLFSQENKKNWWLHSTSIKILQDINDAQIIGIKKYLNYLDYALNPNGEDIAGVKKYNRMVKNIYKNKKPLEVEDYENFIRLLPFENGMADKILRQTKEFLNNPEIINKIKNLYQQTLGIIIK